MSALCFIGLQTSASAVDESLELLEPVEVPLAAFVLLRLSLRLVLANGLTDRNCFILISKLKVSKLYKKHIIIQNLFVFTSFLSLISARK